MNINWVISTTATLDPLISADQLKAIGSLWGSWQTWRLFGTDNVICNDQAKATELCQRNFQNLCNFYISSQFYTKLQKPAGVKLYEGQFIHDVDRQEEIVAMHLAASVSDIVLLLGFDFSEPAKLADRLLEHRANNYRNLVKEAIKQHDKVQWVLIDHPLPLRKDLVEVPNLDRDVLLNILKT